MKKKSTLTVVEDRCDRCNALFSVTHMEGDKPVKRKTGSKKVGSFRMVIGSGKKAVELRYENICETCANRAATMMAAMGKVDRTRGGGRRRKK
jgi:hypothetical protein